MTDTSRNRWRAVLAATILAAGGGAVRAGGDDVATVPYRLVAEKIAAVEASGHRAVARIVSRQPDAGPIRLILDDGVRRTDLPVDPDGRFVLPTGPAFATHDAVIRTNQPRGTLSLEVGPAAN